MIIQTIRSYTYSWVTIFLLYFLVCGLKFVYILYFDNDITLENIIETFMVYLLFHTLIFIKYNLYTLSLIGVFVVLSHFTKLFKYGMYSKLLIIICTSISFCIQLKLLPESDLTHYTFILLCRFYLITSCILLVFLLLYRIIFKEQYRQWIYKNIQCPVSYINKSPYNYNKEHCITASAIIEKIICFILPIAFITITFLL